MCCGNNINSSNKRLQPTLDGVKYVVNDVKGNLLGEFATNVQAQMFKKKYAGSKVLVVKG